MERRSKLIADCKLRSSQGADREDLFSFMRSQGCSKIDCIVMLKEVFGIGLREGKELVHFSAAWEDVREAHDKFHQQLADELGLNDKDPPERQL